MYFRRGLLISWIASCPIPFSSCLNKILKKRRSKWLSVEIVHCTIVHSIVLQAHPPRKSISCYMLQSLYFRIHSRGMLGLLAVSSRIKFYRPLRKDIKADRRPSATYLLWLCISFHCPSLSSFGTVYMESSCAWFLTSNWALPPPHKTHRST